MCGFCSRAPLPAMWKAPHLQSPDGTVNTPSNPMTWLGAKQRPRGKRERERDADQAFSFIYGAARHSDEKFGTVTRKLNQLCASCTTFRLPPTSCRATVVQ